MKILMIINLELIPLLLMEMLDREYKIKVGPLNVLKDFIVVDGGKNYTNKKLIVSPSGISTAYNLVEFKNHGFLNGELIEYSISNDQEPGLEIISGLSTNNKYQILKVDDNKFRLCDAGIGGTITSNFERKSMLNLISSGDGYQQFSYPEIKVDFKFTTIGLGITSIEITPVVKGSISDIQIYEKGVGYGSSIVNYHKKPTLKVQNGKDARVVPNVINGKINSVNVEYGGEEYYSVPDLIITDSSKSGTGAVLRSS